MNHFVTLTASGHSFKLMSMKQKNAADAPVTKKEIKKILEDYPTKDFLSKTINKSFDAFRLEMEYMFKLQDERWERLFLAFESRMYTLVDPLLKELDTRRQDRELTTSQITDLDRRVTKLEHSK